MAAAGFNQGQFGHVIPGWNPVSTPVGPGIPFGPGPGTLAYAALKLTGYMQAGVIPDPEQLQDCFDEANAMLDGYNAQQLVQQFFDDRYFLISTQPANSTQPSYTLGPTGVFNTDVNGRALTYRPQRIVRANLILLSNAAQPTRIPIHIIDVTEYAEIPVIAIQSQVVIRMYVQTTPTNVNLWMFPFPSVGNQIEFFMWPGIPQFASQSSVLAPTTPGFLQAIRDELAYRMMAHVSLEDKGRLQQTRTQYLYRAMIKSRRIYDASNAPTPTLTPDLITETGSGQGSPFNYLTGDFSQ